MPNLYATSQSVKWSVTAPRAALAVRQYICLGQFVALQVAAVRSPLLVFQYLYSYLALRLQSHWCLGKQTREESRENLQQPRRKIVVSEDH